MRKGIYILPNLITLLSMFAGFYSVVASLNSDYERAAWAIMVASVFDVLDGWVARLTHTATRFGIEIDSLADVISFGIDERVSFAENKLRLIDFGPKQSVESATESQPTSPIASASSLAYDRNTGTKRLLKSALRTRADAALTLTAAIIASFGPSTGTASARRPSSSSSSLTA